VDLTNLNAGDSYTVKTRLGKEASEWEHAVFYDWVHVGWDMLKREYLAFQTEETAPGMLLLDPNDIEEVVPE